MDKQVLIMMGSDSDLPVMKNAAEFLERIGISYGIHISSAHRTPEKTAALVTSAEAGNCEVIIAGAGAAAHLAGVIAAQTILPVIGVPIKSDALNGLDSLYATVQMPPGIPVATVAINGAKNAAILAAQIIALKNPALSVKLKELKIQMANEVEAKDAKLNELGIEKYLQDNMNR